MSIYIKLAGLILVCLLMIGVAVNRTQLSSFSQPIYQIKLNSYALNFYSADLAQMIFKVSPFDDYYTTTEKAHLINQEDFLKSETTKDKLFESIIALIFNKHQSSWSAYSKEGLKVDYLVVSQPGNSIKITRKLSGNVKKYSNFTQSIVLCNKCYVTDQNKRFYISKDALTGEDLSLAGSAGMVPVVTTDGLLPYDVKSIIVLDINFNPKITVPIGVDQQVFYDQKWNLLEITDKKNTDSEYSQVVYFN